MKIGTCCIPHSTLLPHFPNFNRISERYLHRQHGSDRAGLAEIVKVRNVPAFRSGKTKGWRHRDNLSFTGQITFRMGNQLGGTKAKPFATPHGWTTLSYHFTSLIVELSESGIRKLRH